MKQYSGIFVLTYALLQVSHARADMCHAHYSNSNEKVRNQITGANIAYPKLDEKWKNWKFQVQLPLNIDQVNEVFTSFYGKPISGVYKDRLILIFSSFNEVYTAFTNKPDRDTWKALFRQAVITLDSASWQIRANSRIDVKTNPQKLDEANYFVLRFGSELQNAISKATRRNCR